jgi:hypothetical protein
VTPKEKEEDGGEPRAESPEPPPSEQTPFQRFEEFARRVISVPRAEIEEREREYRKLRKSSNPKSASTNPSFRNSKEE